MSIAFQTDPIPLKMDDDGGIRVGGTRVTLDILIAEHQLGSTPEQIAAAYDTVPLPDVYAAIGYFASSRRDRCLFGPTATGGRGAARNLSTEGIVRAFASNFWRKRFQG